MESTIRPTLDQFIPEKYKEILQPLGENVDQNLDEIGDIAVLLANALTIKTDKGYRKVVHPTEEKTYPISYLWKAIGEEVGQTGNTIRGWERYCRLFTRKLRGQYDMLNRSQRKFFVDKSGGDPDKIKHYIDLWLDQAGSGNVGSYQALISWWKRKKGAPPQWQGWYATAETACKKLFDYQSRPGEDPPPSHYVRAASAFLSASKIMIKAFQVDSRDQQSPEPRP